MRKTWENNNENISSKLIVENKAYLNFRINFHSYFPVNYNT